MPDLLQIMKDAYANDYRGSISELMQQAILQETQIATTPEQQQAGLSGQSSPSPMLFPNVQGQSFNTVGMKGPIDFQQFDKSGLLIDSRPLPPGLVDVPTHPETHTVLEVPSFKDGGTFVPLRERLRNYRPGSTLKKK
jgi:hypothetical protein